MVGEMKGDFSSEQTQEGSRVNQPKVSYGTLLRREILQQMHKKDQTGIWSRADQHPVDDRH
jgi:hypothetical protein